MRATPILSGFYNRATSFKPASKNNSPSHINTTKKSGLGILGGSFDPIHLGHTQSAQAVANELALSHILLIPAYISPLKVTPDLVPHASAEQRASMVELACQQSDLFSCDTQELTRAGRSYTVDTLNALKQQYPEHILHFIIGMDSLLTFSQWHQYQEILALCHLIVNTRPNYNVDKINTETKALLTARQTTNKADLLNFEAGKIFFAEPVLFNVSSTQIRQRIAQRQSTEQQLHPKVLDYINKNNLYR
ncbi:nicotinate-nucleotide adenylyltransferase [Colwellia sp. E2M01]|nr:nicotinate-nucleotide adenylyltransferase [Colwellia sp. E2M01]